MQQDCHPQSAYCAVERRQQKISHGNLMSARFARPLFKIAYATNYLCKVDQIFSAVYVMCT